MRKIKITLLVIATLLCGSLSAQNISDALGAVKTSFEFYSDTTNLDVTSQFLIKRGATFKKSKTHKGRDYERDWGYGYGYAAGYESYHLEFVTVKDLSIKKERWATTRYEVKFVDSDKTILANATLKDDKVSHYSNPSITGTPIFYSFDLINIPIPVLDKTSSIYITVIRSK